MLDNMDDLFTAPILTPETRFAAAFAVEAGDFDQVHHLMGGELPDVERLESEARYGETLRGPPTRAAAQSRRSIMTTIDQVIRSAGLDFIVSPIDSAFRTGDEKVSVSCRSSARASDLASRLVDAATASGVEPRISRHEEDADGFYIAIAWTD